MIEWPPALMMVGTNAEYAKNNASSIPFQTKQVSRAMWGTADRSGRTDSTGIGLDDTVVSDENTSRGLG